MQAICDHTQFVDIDGCRFIAKCTHFAGYIVITRDLTPKYFCISHVPKDPRASFPLVEKYNTQKPS
jgi:hypothetical protein